MILFKLFKQYWVRFWMRYAGLSTMGRIATVLAAWFSPPYKGRRYLAKFNKNGYISPSASVYCDNLKLGNNIFIGDRVIIYKNKSGGMVTIGKNVSIYNDSIIEVGGGGSLIIGDNTHIQPHCQFSAYKGTIEIGCNVQIAPKCAFYPYNHGFTPGEIIMKQPIETKGGIVIADNVWLGFGVIVLDGVRIGNGAVIGAGAVVNHDIPDNAIAVGVPARIIKMRDRDSIDMNIQLLKLPVFNKREIS
ncbi:MAG: acyltransferase [Candidatus Jettenia sp. CY-1]|nr:MAG: acyltransferase [Candidatus Jettenia sp. CY-1]